MAGIPIILDCDPGHDDALAIALALASPELRPLAITTVAGNAPLDRTTRNALRVLTLLGRTDVPVAAGADRPIVRDPWVPVEFHGDSGLDGADLPEPAVGPAEVGAVELAGALLRRAGEPVTLVATGPLTNMALLLRAAPGLRDRIAEISLMGGSLGEGNTTAAAEFNIWADPEAAAIVFDSGIPIRMAGLDVTHQALVLPADIDRLEALGTRPGTGLRRPDAVLRDPSPRPLWLGRPADPRCCRGRLAGAAGPGRLDAAADRHRDVRRPDPRPDRRRPGGADRAAAQRDRRADASTASA